MIFLKTAFAVGCGLITLRFIYALVYLPKVRALLLQTENHSIARNRNELNFYIFIPLLNEVEIFSILTDRLERAFKSFENTTIIFITTEREFRDTENIKQSTIDLVREYVASCNSELVRHAHYPEINSRVAEQINYAVSEIQLEVELNLEKTFFGFYNADSNISNLTIPVLEHEIQSFPTVKIFQQSSAFLANSFSGLAKYVLYANAIRQTRWTFLYEIPRYIRSWSAPINLTHVVTHGLFIQGNALKKVGNFPIDSYGEDLYLGFVLHAFGLKVRPLPVLENSESPSSLTAMMRQKFVWYWGPYGYFYYWRRIKVRFPAIWKVNKTIFIGTTILGILDAINWLLVGPLYLFFIMISFKINMLIGVFSVLLLLGYFGFTCVYTLLIYSDRPDKMIFPKLTLFAQILGVALYPVIVLIHGIPPIITIFKDIKLRISKETYLRPKTERA